MSLLSWAVNAVTSGALDTFFLRLYEKYDNFSKNEMVKKGIGFITKGQARDRVWSFVVVILPKKGPESRTASQQLIERQRLRQHVLPRPYDPDTLYQHGDEEKLLEILAIIYASCVNDTKVNEDQLAEILTVFGNMPDSEFDTVIEGFDNDRLRQLSLRYWSEAVAAYKRLYQRFNEAGERVRDYLLRSGRI